MPENVQVALAAMCFQLGWPSLSGFRKVWLVLEGADFPSAARHALDSKWARDDTPGRARRVAAVVDI